MQKFDSLKSNASPKFCNPKERLHVLYLKAVESSANTEPDRD